MPSLPAIAQGLAGEGAPKFLGVQSCASSGCHGGAKDNFNQVIAWEKHDFHTRSYATLTTARSRQMARALQLDDPAASARCTVCHAPFHEVPREQRDASIKIGQGVSCENCHGPAEAWLRTHTRTDLSHGEKVAAGMRDLRNFYTRANTCVACHQNVEPDLLRAGHPGLTFELDGQCVTEPRHWRERSDHYGVRLWLAGQSVALREMSWALAKQARPDEGEVTRWKALLWLLGKVGASVSDARIGAPVPFRILEPTPENLAGIQKQADDQAKISEQLPADLIEPLLRGLAGVAEDFTDGKVPVALHARRAERLVLALDRLVMALPSDGPAAKAKKELDALFHEVQSLPDFDAGKFSRLLRKFEGAVSPAIRR